MATLRELGEREAVARLRALCAPGPGVVVGAGDDAAVLELPPDVELVATTDALVQGVHWLPAWMSARQVGARAAAANLSDLAAMAATPLWALASFGLGEESTWEWLEGCQGGLVEALSASGASLVGGNLTRTAGEPWLSLTLLGSVPRGKAWRRSGARPGDVLGVSGVPGRAGAAARLVHARGSVARGYRGLIAAWQSPAARVREAQALARLDAVRAAIDLSDGLSSDLCNLCEASGTGARIEEALLPTTTELEQAARELGVPILDLQLGPSDDYELLVAVDPERWSALAAAGEALHCPLTRIGLVTPAAEGIVLRGVMGGKRPIAAQGWDHFRAR
jgi:thiamine-monophosphate kinase